MRRRRRLNDTDEAASIRGIRAIQGLSRSSSTRRGFLGEWSRSRVSRTLLPRIELAQADVSAEPSRNSRLNGIEMKIIPQCVIKKHPFDVRDAKERTGGRGERKVSRGETSRIREIETDRREERERKGERSLRRR